MTKSYQKSWFTLDDYLKIRNWNKYKVNKVPPAFNNYFSTAEEMWEMLTVRIQEMINLYFNGYFDFIPFEFLKPDYQFWIKMAIFDTFEAIMNGRMPFYSNVELIFTNNNQNYSLTNAFKNDNNSYADIFPPQAIKWLSMTNLRSVYKFKNWQEAFDYWVNQLDPDHLITLEEIEKLFDALDLTNTNLLATIQETLEKYKTDNETWKTQTLEMINNRISVTEIAKEITVDKDAMNQIGKVTAKTIAESDELVQPLTDVAVIAANATATSRLNDFVNTAGSNEGLVNNIASAISGDIADIPQIKNDVTNLKTTIVEKYAGKHGHFTYSPTSTTDVSFHIEKVGNHQMFLFTWHIIPKVVGKGSEGVATLVYYYDVLQDNLIPTPIMNQYGSVVGVVTVHNYAMANINLGTIEVSIHVSSIADIKSYELAYIVLEK